MTQCFCILSNAPNYSGCDNDLHLHTTLTTLLTGIIFHDSKLSNGPGFYNQNIECLQIPLYNAELKLLLGLSFEIVITGYAYAITAFLVNVRPSNILG